MIRVHSSCNYDVQKALIESQLRIMTALGVPNTDPTFDNLVIALDDLLEAKLVDNVNHAKDVEKQLERQLFIADGEYGSDMNADLLIEALHVATARRVIAEDALGSFYRSKQFDQK